MRNKVTAKRSECDAFRVSPNGVLYFGRQGDDYWSFLYEPDGTKRLRPNQHPDTCWREATEEEWRT